VHVAIAIVTPLCKCTKQGAGQPGAGKAELHRAITKSQMPLHQALMLDGDVELA